MAEDKNYTNNKERPREDEELEIDLMEYVRKLWAARKVLLKAAGIGAIVGVIIALSIPKQYTVEVTLSPESGKSGGGACREWVPGRGSAALVWAVRRMRCT